MHIRIDHRDHNGHSDHWDDLDIRYIEHRHDYFFSDVDFDKRFRFSSEPLFFAQRDHIMSITTLTEEVHLLTKYINMVFIRVINRNTGNPVSYANVSIHFNSLTRIGRSTGRTDSSGVASINTDPAYDGEVYINGKRVHKGRVTADMSFSV